MKVEDLAEEIEEKVERLKTAAPWESALLAREIAESAATLRSIEDLRDANASVGTEVPEPSRRALVR